MPLPLNSHTTVLVFGGGDVPTATDRARFPDVAMVIAADAGADHALACERRVDLVVGDLDSVSETGLAAAVGSGAVVERHDCEKDESDLELALRRAVDHSPHRIVLTAVSGGRSDHAIANLLLATGPATAGVLVDVVSGDDQMFVIRGSRWFEVEPGQLVTLLPVHGPAVGVSTTGLQYSLDCETLEPGSTRGISNVAVSARVAVEIEGGVLLALVPGSAAR